MCHWQPGEHMLVEKMGFGVPFMTLPVTVVWDRPDELALWFADGTPYLHRVQPDGTGIPRVITRDAFVQLDSEQVVTAAPGRTVLAVVRPGRAHATQLHWDMPGWRFRQWYVDLQSPVERTDRGIRTTDHFLDLVVKPDLTCHWKDEDELAEAVEVGRLTASEAAAVRAEGERVVADVEARRPPFASDFVEWRPDPAWDRPEIPAGWDEGTD